MRFLHAGMLTQKRTAIPFLKALRQFLDAHPGVDDVEALFVGPPGGLPGLNDGMAVDCAGNVISTLPFIPGTVSVFSPSGDFLGAVGSFGGGAYNVAYGGEDGKLLAIGRAIEGVLGTPVAPDVGGFLQ